MLFRLQPHVACVKTQAGQLETRQNKLKFKPMREGGQQDTGEDNQGAGAGSMKPGQDTRENLHNKRGNKLKTRAQEVNVENKLKITQNMTIMKT